jgi:hypothetical protein
MLDVVDVTGQQVVDADHFVSLLQQAVVRCDPRNPAAPVTTAVFFLWLIMRRGGEGKQARSLWQSLILQAKACVSFSTIIAGLCMKWLSRPKIPPIPHHAPRALDSPVCFFAPSSWPPAVLRIRDGTGELEKNTQQTPDCSQAPSASFCSPQPPASPPRTNGLKSSCCCRTSALPCRSSSATASPCSSAGRLATSSPRTTPQAAAAKQVEQFRQAIAAKPAAIFVSPIDPPAFAALIVEAQTAGIIVIGLDKRMLNEGCTSIVYQRPAHRRTPGRRHRPRSPQAQGGRGKPQRSHRARHSTAWRRGQPCLQRNRYGLQRGPAHPARRHPGPRCPADWTSETATQRTTEAFRLQKNFDVDLRAQRRHRRRRRKGGRNRR